MGASRIEQLIEDIYDFVDGCRTQALSSNKVIVPKDSLYDLLDELRLRTPDEIKRYQKIIANRDAIISDAETKAATTLAEAEAAAKHMLDDNEIMQQAYNQANEIVNAANDEANRMLESAKAEATELIKAAKDSAESMLGSARIESDSMVSESYAYANDLLGMIETVLQNTVNESKSRFDAVHATLTNSLNVVRDNREQINRQANSAVANQNVPQQQEAPVAEQVQPQPAPKAKTAKEMIANQEAAADFNYDTNAK